MMRSASVSTPLVVFMLSGSAWAIAPPSLPETWVNTTLPTQTGVTVTVPYTGNAATDATALQAALDAANYGDTIKIAHAGTFAEQTGAGFQLKLNHADTSPRTGSGWIVVESDAVPSLPVSGIRVAPSDAANMPTITGIPGALYAIFAQSSAHHWRFIGLNVTAPATGTSSFNAIGLGDNTQPSSATLPNNIIVDRCYIHGDSTNGGRRGLILNGSYEAVVDSYISDWFTGGQSTGVAGWQGSGPLKIVNNYIEAGGSNIGIGGAASSIHANPFDIEIRLNTLYIQPAFYSFPSCDIRNLLEFKAGVRALIEANTFQNMHTGGCGSYGAAIQVGPPPSPDSAWEADSDFTLRNNRFTQLGGGAVFGGTNGTAPATTRVAITNNLWTNITVALGASGAGGSWLTFPNGVDNVTILHNTSVQEGSTSLTNLSGSGCVISAQQILWENNIQDSGAFGNQGGALAGCTPGNFGEAAVSSYWPGSHVYDTNVQIGPWPTSGGVSPSTWYPAWFGSHPSWFPSGANLAAALSGVGFINAANCLAGTSVSDCELTALSPFHNAATDGTDVGFNLTAFNAAFALGNNAYPSSVTGPGATISGSVTIQGGVTIK